MWYLISVFDYSMFLMENGSVCGFTFIRKEAFKSISKNA